MSFFRAAKRKMDEQSFFGGLLHVCYAPEFETVEETRKKLRERKSYIARVTENKGMKSQLLNTFNMSILKMASDCSVLTLMGIEANK